MSSSAHAGTAAPATLAGRAETLPEEPEYITRQRERLQALKERESQASEVDDGSARMAAYAMGAFFFGLFAWIGYSIWETQARAKEMKAFLDEKKAEEGVVALPSGLLYKVITAGDGSHHPTHKSTCLCNYRGTLTDGKEFDASAEGKPASFQPLSLIRGWSEALQLMVVGDRWMLYVPAELAYHGNSQPGIPASSALVFDLELVGIQGPKKNAVRAS